MKVNFQSSFISILLKVRLKNTKLVKLKKNVKLPVNVNQSLAYKGRNTNLYNVYVIKATSSLPYY